MSRQEGKFTHKVRLLGVEALEAGGVILAAALLGLHRLHQGGRFGRRLGAPVDAKSTQVGATITVWACPGLVRRVGEHQLAAAWASDDYVHVIVPSGVSRPRRGSSSPPRRGRGLPLRRGRLGLALRSPRVSRRSCLSPAPWLGPARLGRR